MDSIEELGRLDLPDVSIAMRVKQEHRGENGGKRDREGDLKRKEGERKKKLKFKLYVRRGVKKYM